MRIFLVHQRAARVAVRCEVDMHFGARPTGTGVAHHPEIVSLATVENVNSRIEIRFAKQMSPVLICFLVEFAGFARTGFVNGCVKPWRWKFPPLDE